VTERATRWYTPVCPMSDTSDIAIASEPLKLGYDRGTTASATPFTTVTVAVATTCSCAKVTDRTPDPDADAFG